MIPTEIEQRRKMISYILEKCDSSPEELTEWEQNFITSINEQSCDKNNLTDK